MGNVNGRGYPVFIPTRSQLNGQVVPTPDAESISFDENGGQHINSPGENFEKKLVREIVVDLTNAFTDQLYLGAGSLVWFSGQTGGTAAPMFVRPDSLQNGRIPLTFGNGFSGISFNRFYLTNTVAQPGLTATFTVILDTIKDRVGITS